MSMISMTMWTQMIVQYCFAPVASGLLLHPPALRRGGMPVSARISLDRIQQLSNVLLS